MHSVHYGTLGPERARGVVVLLPGLGDAATEFEERGFVAALLARGQFDIVAADAHFGYYRTRSVAERLLTDIIRPARRRGYRKVWLVGISLGGFGALEVLRVASAEVEGAVVLAPYLGPEAITQEIRAAGGLRNWHENPNSADDSEARSARRLWLWLKHAAVDDELRQRLFLGVGDDDRFWAANQLLVEVLPSEHTLTLSGGHEWSTWRRLLEPLSRAAWDREMQLARQGSKP
jgi:pimeloyl-ACP methyl ester carboxylesterase